MEVTMVGFMPLECDSQNVGCVDVVLPKCLRIAERISDWLWKGPPLWLAIPNLSLGAFWSATWESLIETSWLSQSAQVAKNQLIRVSIVTDRLLPCQAVPPRQPQPNKIMSKTLLISTSNSPVSGASSRPLCLFYFRRPRTLPSATNPHARRCASNCQRWARYQLASSSCWKHYLSCALYDNHCRACNMPQ